MKVINEVMMIQVMCESITSVKVKPEWPELCKNVGDLSAGKIKVHSQSDFVAVRLSDSAANICTGLAAFQNLVLGNAINTEGK